MGEGKKWAYEDVVLDEVGVALRLKVKGALLLAEIVMLFGLARRTAHKSRKYHDFTYVYAVEERGVRDRVGVELRLRLLPGAHNALVPG